MLFNLQPFIYRYNNRSSYELSERETELNREVAEENTRDEVVGREYAGSSNAAADHSQSLPEGKDEESNERLSGQIEEEEDDLSNGVAEAEYNNENDARGNSSTDDQR